jgi:Cu(I)/Ag(I) efflux system membrane fusion protein
LPAFFWAQLASSNKTPLWGAHGQTAEIKAGFLGGKTLTGKIVSVDRVIDTNSRTAKARILVAEGATLLRPESYVDVTIHAPLGAQISVPFDAVLDTGKQAWVFLMAGPGFIEPRLIHIKFYAGDNIAVEGGLTPGQKIVTSANFLIDSESRLRSASSEAATSAPSCQKGQHWDLSMSMCMQD